ncbi:MAG TPA: DUF3093 domain-containing protein [Mycobacteriales bacterium]|nr:DUF3093 domain-containing protein [Mycobacteriales bacterium]
MPRSAADRDYVERLRVPPWWHALSPLFAVIFGIEGLLSDHTVATVSMIAGFWIAAELVLWSLGRQQVSVVDGKLRAGNWRLPAARVRAAATLDAAQTRAEQRRADSQVYRCTVPWVHSSVMLQVDDPDDKPLWLISTRHPDRLTSALTDAVSAPAPAPGARA